MTCSCLKPQATLRFGVFPFPPEVNGTSTEQMDSSETFRLTLDKQSHSHLLSLVCMLYALLNLLVG